MPLEGLQLCLLQCSAQCTADTLMFNGVNNADAQCSDPTIPRGKIR